MSILNEQANEAMRVALGLVQEQASAITRTLDELSALLIEAATLYASGERDACVAKVVEATDLEFEVLGDSSASGKLVELLDIEAEFERADEAHISSKHAAHSQRKAVPSFRR